LLRQRQVDRERRSAPALAQHFDDGVVENGSNSRAIPSRPRSRRRRDRDLPEVERRSSAKEPEHLTRRLDSKN
jgi:hypothetical protein